MPNKLNQHLAESSEVAPTFGARNAPSIVIGLLVATISTLPVILEISDGLVWQRDSRAYVSAAHEPYRGEPTNWFSATLLLAALLVSAACLIKNIGFTLLIPFLLTLVVSIRRQWIGTSAGSVLVAIAISGYVATWWRNHLLGVGDRGLGGPGGWYSPSDIVLQVLQWTGGILTPPSLVWIASFSGLAALIAVAASPFSRRDTRFVLGTFAIYTYVYLGMFGFHLVFNPNSPLEWRYVLPVVPIVVVNITVMVGRNYPRLSE